MSLRPHLKLQLHSVRQSGQKVVCIQIYIYIKKYLIICEYLVIIVMIVLIGHMNKHYLYQHIQFMSTISRYQMQMPFSQYSINQLANA